MDIYGLMDLVAVIAVIAGIAVAVHIRNKESILLAVFFTLSSLGSLILFQTDCYEWQQHYFVALSVVFGLATNKHPVTLGYAGYLILIGLNSIYEVTMYTFYIYLIYAYQLWMVHYESRGSRLGCIWISHFDTAHNKNYKKKEAM